MPQNKNEEISPPTPAPFGQIAWHDLTVPNAEAVRDFYAAVVGWKFGTISMGDYDDFTMIASHGGTNAESGASTESEDEDEGETVAGICWARGANAGLPAQWLMRITVADVGQSAKACVSLGGSQLTPIKSIGDASFCIIRDPAGAVCGLYGPRKQDSDKET